MYDLYELNWNEQNKYLSNRIFTHHDLKEKLIWIKDFSLS